MKVLNIKYINSHSFVGEHHSMIVDGETYSLRRGEWRYEGKWGDEIDHAIYILKSEYGVVRMRKDIIFEWDGSM